MADVFIVLLAKAGGEIGGVFSTLPLAQSYVQTRPPCNWSIVQRTIDDPPAPNLSADYFEPSHPGVVKQGHRNS